MTVEDYQALAIMSVFVWRIIAAIRTPVLHPIKRILTGVDDEGKPVGFGGWENGKWMYSFVVWLFAFIIAYVIAQSAGVNGNMLKSLGWENDYSELGWAFTAGLIASGSAGMRLAEKFYEAKSKVSK